MNASLKIRRQVETALARRIPSALSPRMQAERPASATGIAEIDALLHGGLPVGALTEFVGDQGSGRTTLALSFLAGMTRDGNVGAWIDVADVLCPESAAASGVDLERLLWIRCGDTVQSAPPEAKPSFKASVTSSEAPLAAQAVQGGGSPHPRGESRGMPEALSNLFQSHVTREAIASRRKDKSIGTPGRENRPIEPHSKIMLLRSVDREEQIATDRLPPRRGETVLAAQAQSPSWEPRCAEAQHNRRRDPNSATSSEPLLPPEIFRSQTPGREKTWKRIDHALRTTDLLLQAGGFSTIILDLGSIPAEYAWKIPLATWFRFRAAAERSRSSVLLLTQHPCARSSAELVLHLASQGITPDGPVLAAMAYQVEIARKRFDTSSTIIPIRKPPQSEQRTTWRSGAAWVRQR